MSVNGVSQRPDALLQQSALPGREARPADTAVRTEAPPRVERPEPAATRPVEAPEAPKPVVNTQGQTTGTRINTTA